VQHDGVRGEAAKRHKVDQVAPLALVLRCRARLREHMRAEREHLRKAKCLAVCVVVTASMVHLIALLVKVEREGAVRHRVLEKTLRPGVVDNFGLQQLWWRRRRRFCLGIWLSPLLNRASCLKRS